MKKLMVIVLAVAVVAAMMAGPAAAVDTGITIDAGGSVAPYMVCATMTPDVDGVAGNGVQVNPEFAIPNADGTFPNTDNYGLNDGWQMVKFYVEVGHTQDITKISQVSIDVFYPDVLPAEDLPIFADRAGMQKFEVHAIRDANTDSGWKTELVYPWNEFYPDCTPAAAPDLWKARELVNNQASDVVDVNCDHFLGNDNDMAWVPFLGYWTDSRINYAADQDAVSAAELYRTQQALVIEIKGWIWYHQPGVKYTVEAKAQTLDSAVSETLDDGGKYFTLTRQVGLYCDFDQIAWDNVSSGESMYNVGDRFLTTDNKTTIWNNGNAPAEVVLDSTRMVLVAEGNNTYPIVGDIHNHQFYCIDSKSIDTFDAKLYYMGGVDNVLTQMGEIMYQADTPTVIVNDMQDPAELSVEGNMLGPVLLQQCRPAKIEFSVHPEPGQTAGQYAGILTITTQAYTGDQPVTPYVPCNVA